MRLRYAWLTLVVLSALAGRPARAASSTAAAMDDAGILLSSPQKVAAIGEPDPPAGTPRLKVYPGHVSGNPPKAYRGGFCYLELEDGERAPASLAKVDAAQLRRVINVEDAPQDPKLGNKGRRHLEHQLRSVGSLLGAPPVKGGAAPVTSSQTGQKEPNINGTISGFGSAGPGSTNFTIKHGVQVQTFFQHSDFDFDSPDRESRNRDSFTLRRLVIYAIGELGRPSTTWSYTLIAQGPIMFGTHAWVQEEFAHYFRIRMGEFKMPTARQQLAPTRELLTIDKSLATRVFVANSLNPLGGDSIDVQDISLIPTHAGGDNIGIQFWGETADGNHKDDPQLRYFLGAFKGPATGAKGPLRSGLIDATALVNDNTGLMYIGRLELMPLGYVPYSEGALDNTGKPRLGIDLTCSLDDNNVRIDINHNGKQGVDFGDEEDRIAYALGLRSTVQRMSLSAEYFHEHTRPVAADLPHIDSWGYYWTLGYMIKPKKVEICYNDSQVNLDQGRTGSRLRECGPALNYYLAGHKQKLTCDFTRMQSEVEPSKNRTEARLQYLYAF